MTEHPIGQCRASGASRDRQAGVSLLEVLIAVLVVSIGILGAARLQLTSKHANLESSQRAAATLLAQEIFERMRGNRASLAVYTADGAELAAAPEEPATDCASAECTAEDLARYDLWEWWQSVQGVTEQAARAEEGGEAVLTPVGGLAAPTVCVSGPAGGPGNYQVTLAWRGMTPLADPAGVACGQDAAAYATPDADAGESLRRVLVVESYIGD
jgi:type IV pilus assembly protein PilV